MNKYSSSGQYYNELVCDPNDPDVVYSMDTYTQVTRDGGKTWDNISLNKRHVDDHAMWIDPDDSNHWMIGGDGGIYETFDNGTHYIHKTNLPVTQFYRVNVDNTEPFYWVYGGTQDNNSMGGPSQNTSSNGVSSSEWIVTLGGDGFWQAIEEDNPDIVYSAYQYGNIFRYDKKSGEKVKIKPEPRKDELHYRWNWDAPFLLSKHKTTRLYMAANKVFKSDDRGHSWEVISDDLTRDEDRNQFQVMGKYWPSNAVAKDVSSSQWGTIVALAESPIKAGLLYVGTDDGLIQVTEDDGATWTKISSFPGVPDYAYVSDVLPSRFDENVVFATFSNLKNDDFKAYVLKSTDKGKSWTSIAANLPEETAHTIAQDFVNPDLLFVGTEFNFFVSVDGGKVWTELGNGLPDIAVRDIAIQERESDLAIATFGRGFYILDNYSPLRDISPQKLESEKAVIFPIKDALMFVQEGGRYGTGSTYYTADNPKFGAVFTYYLKEVPKTKKQERLKKEKELFKEGKPIPQPTQEQLREEEAEIAPYLIFTIRDEQGNAVRRLFEKPSKGLNRINWDLRYEMPRAQDDDKASFEATGNNRSGYFALPGKYSVEMALGFGDEVKPLTEAVAFEAITLNNKTLPVENPEAVDQFYADLTELRKTYDATARYFALIKNRNENIRQVLHQMPEPQLELEKQTRELAGQLDAIDFVMNGSSAKASFEEVPPEPVSLRYRLGAILSGTWSHSGEPTQTMRTNYNILKDELAPVIDQLNQIDNKLNVVENQMDELGAPYTPGRKPKLK
ncbi:MAG: glycosyl hydrolase [Bacteroidetes bacterium]|nr:glycosyl hydrolase [Bacteroidota bacterium]MBU1580036.1 glycosyl hydrolase [Bacteroidota bacterium]